MKPIIAALHRTFRGLCLHTLHPECGGMAGSVPAVAHRSADEDAPFVFWARDLADAP